MMDKCMPCANQIFTGVNEPMKFMHVNDYVIEKAFVHAIYFVSKNLGENYFSWGQHTWPPPVPPEVFGEDPDEIQEVGATTSAASSS